MTDSLPDIDEIKEKLAAIEHERWADWQKWMHSRLVPHDDSHNPNKVLDVNIYEAWERQLQTPYKELTVGEKDSDREQVDRYWPLIEAYVQEQTTAARIDELEKLWNKLPEAMAHNSSMVYEGYEIDGLIQTVLKHLKIVQRRCDDTH